MTHHPGTVMPCIVCGSWVAVEQLTPEQTCGWICTGIATSAKWKLGAHPIQNKRKKAAGEPQLFKDGGDA
jgi:hypothetical protein